MRGLNTVFVCSLIVFSGCSQSGDKWKNSRPKTVSASGVISLGGKPLAGAQVVLVPPSGGHGGSALSATDGSFRLATFPPDEGAVPGSYKVMIVKSVVPQNPDPGSPESTVPQYAKLLIPEKYTDPETSGLTIEIPVAGTKEIKIDLRE